MKKFRNNQKQFYKKSQDGEIDISKIDKGNDKRGGRVTRKKINIIISQKAFDRLIELSEEEQLSRRRILTRIIITQLQVYAKLRKNNSPTKRYNGDESLISPTNQEIRNKGIEEERQVAYQITSRALKET